uniref:Uncharacterized protein n=1 Tax=Arundo donax TaxID=35708 RepID=A0A0A9TZU7_ARUDO
MLREKDTKTQEDRYKLFHENGNFQVAETEALFVCPLD